MIERLKVRISDINTEVSNELIETAKDRIMLRIGQLNKPFPKQLESVCVEIVTAMYRRQEMKHEGTDSESVDGFSIKFINDLLKEYDDELMQYKQISQIEEDSTRGKIRFI